MEVIALTTVSGNAPVSHTSANALKIASAFGMNCPVYAGCEKSMSNAYEYPTQFHGKTGMDSAGSEFVNHGLSLAEGHAVNAMVDLVEKYSNDISIVAIGPLTNIATALMIAPDMATKVKELIIMGGGHNFGNITPAAEFNIWADPVRHASFFKVESRSLSLG